MSQCFSWHNLRYIKNQQNLEVFNANIIVFLQGIMYAHNRRQRRARACAHMCTARSTHTHKYIPSMFLGIDEANDSQMELFWLNCVDTLHKKRARWLHADSWLTWTWTRCFVWSTLAQTCLYFWFGVNLVWAPAGWGLIFPIQTCCQSWRCIQKF